METYIKILNDSEFGSTKIVKLNSKGKLLINIESSIEKVNEMIDIMILKNDGNLNEEFVLETFRELGWNAELIEPEHTIFI